MNRDTSSRRRFMCQIAGMGAGATLAGHLFEPIGGEAAETAVAAGDKHPAYRTAKYELDIALAMQPFAGEIVIGFAGDRSAAIKSLAEGDLITVHQVSTERDAYEILVREGVLYLLGNTPRGMLNAVFALQEMAAAKENLAEGVHRRGEFHFSRRIFHPRFDAWPGERADVRYIAHLGASHCLVCHDWQGSRRSLQGYVTSPIFPEAVDADVVAKNHARLRRLLDDCADYGLGVMLWLTELPCQGGPWVPEKRRQQFISRYSPDVLSDSGTNEGQVLCFGHPRVQEYYRDLLQRFFRDFPEIECIFLFGLDSSGEFCDPQKCHRCRGMSLFDQRDRLVRFLIEEGGRVRPGLRVLTTGWKWDRQSKEFLERQTELPEASGLYLAAEKDGWQCERQFHDLLADAKNVCADKNQLFIGYDNFHWGDDSIHRLGDIQDFPLGIAAKIRRWRKLNADGVFDHWGGVNQNVWCNSIACREFFLNPAADAEAVCRKIARRQFGPTAGQSAFEAWQSLERAHESLSRACTWAPMQWPMWYKSRSRPPTPENLSTLTKKLEKTRQPPRKADDGTIYNPPDLADSLQLIDDSWRKALPHFNEAVGHLKQAEATADDEPLFYRYWWNGQSAVPSRREHLRLQKLYVESMLVFGREMGLQFALHALWERVDHDAESYREKAEPLLAECAEACRQAAAYFRAIGRPKDWPAQYDAKLGGIEAYIARK